MANQFKLSPQEARKLWVEALRSGRYEQGRSFLRCEDKFCCLGVACDLFIQNEHEIPVKDSPTVWEYDGRTGGLPVPVRNWLSMTSTEAEYRCSSLTTDNDAGKTFTEIADIIESNPPGLFTE